jgi:hypothetical protein
MAQAITGAIEPAAPAILKKSWKVRIRLAN